MLQKLRKWLSPLGPAPALIGLVAFCVFVAIWFSRDDLSELLTSDATAQSRVAISVATPTVHTRERLLNDRFEQVAWLDEELESTRPKKSDAAPSAQPAVSAPASPATPKEAADQKLNFVSESTEQLRYGADDPRKPFEMMNGYRDVLRAERARAMLDDRHDMDDNTLDLFSFDTTVMPRDGMHGSAAIEVLLTRDASELLADVPGRSEAEQRLGYQKYKDLFDTYVGWLEKVRSVQQSSLDTLTRTLDTAETWQESSDFELLLRRNACSELLRHSEPPANPADTRQAAETRQSRCRSTVAGTTPWDRWERFDKPPQPDRAALDVMRQLDDTLASVRTQILEKSAADFIEQVRQWQHSTLTGAGPVDPAILAAFRNSRLPDASRIAADCMGKSPEAAQPGVPIVPRLIADAFGQAYPQLNPMVFYCKISPNNMPLRVLWAVIDKLAPSNEAVAASEAMASPEWTVVVVKGVTLSSRDLDRVPTSCVAAALIEENAVRPTAEQPRNHGASLTKFFDIRVDRLVSGCSLSVIPEVTSLRLPDRPPGSSNIVQDVQKLVRSRSLLHKLDVLLEGPGYGDLPYHDATVAYGYSLSPRLQQNVEVRRDTRDAASAALGQGGGSVNRSRGLDFRGVEPEVVGFMRSTRANTARRGARFGWLLTPRPGKENTYSVPLEQAELGAVVALPSWWRSALLQICTRFVFQSNTGGVFTDEFWNHKDQCRVEMIRLPGSSLEVSRRLGMDVLTTPFMSAWKSPPVLAAGAGPAAESTQLVITGERLWRNTVVTLGDQKADRIEVLPDMVGIAATFRCIRRPATGAVTVLEEASSDAPNPPPASASAAADKGPDAPAMQRPKSPHRVLSYTVPVTVWTSEGHTHSQPATVVADQEGQYKPCPSEVTDSTLER